MAIGNNSKQRIGLGDFMTVFYPNNEYGNGLVLPTNTNSIPYGVPLNLSGLISVGVYLTRWTPPRTMTLTGYGFTAHGAPVTTGQHRFCVYDTAGNAVNSLNTNGIVSVASSITANTGIGSTVITAFASGYYPVLNGGQPYMVGTWQNAALSATAQPVHVPYGMAGKSYALADGWVATQSTSFSVTAGTSGFDLNMNYFLPLTALRVQS